MIKTSLNLQQSQADKIIELSRKLNITISSILNSLTQFALQNHRYKTRLRHAVSYQQNPSDNNSWYCLHVTFSDDTYEKCLDVRKFCKISVSSFLSSAIDLYLDIVIKNIINGKRSDNYLNNYSVSYIKNNDSIEIIIKWGKETNRTAAKPKIYRL